MDNNENQLKFELLFTYSYWNYVTQSYEVVNEMTDEKAVELIPQNPAAIGLYKLYRSGFGLSIQESMIKVLKACIGLPDND